MEKLSHRPAQVDILLVDDVPANLQVLVAMLRQQNIKVRPVTNGPMALEAAASKPPQLILLDINMPEMDGYEVCRQLKANPMLADIPVVFLSANNETFDKVKAFHAGGVDYITKPFELEEVTARINNHLESYWQKQHIKENYEKLRVLEELRDKLVHLLIHDLRSPLAIVSGFLKIVLKGERDHLSAEGVSGLEKAISQTKRLVSMVSTVLDVSKIEEAKMKTQITKCDFNDILSQLSNEFAPLLGNKSFDFNKTAEPVLIDVDRELIERVLSNLMINAIKFTPITGGEIRLGFEATGDCVRVAVSDNGSGIPPEGQTKLFEKFSQVESANGRAKSSSGLGLYFCRLAIEAHGGQIGVISEENRGTTFWFTLPLVHDRNG